MCKEKKPLSKKISISWPILGVFLEKYAFLAEKTLYGQTFKKLFLLILARTGFVVIVRHFFDGQIGFLAKYWHFRPILSNARPKNISNKLPRCFFPLGGYQHFYLLPKKLGFLAQKRPNLVQNLHFWSFWAKYCHFLHMPD